MDDPYTMELRLCDDDGWVTDTPVEPGSPGTLLDPNLTYRKLHDNLRRYNANPDTRKRYEGPDYGCTGHAHLACEHIRCTSPAHDPKPVTAGPAFSYASALGITYPGLDTIILNGQEYRRV